jgi:hypothetical protein
MVHTLKFKASVDHQFAKRYFTKDPIWYFNEYIGPAMSVENKLPPFKERPHSCKVEYEMTPGIWVGYNYTVTYVIEVNDLGIYGDGYYVIALIAFHRPHTLLEHTILPRGLYDNLTRKPARETKPYPPRESMEEEKYPNLMYRRKGKKIQRLKLTGSDKMWRNIKYEALPEDIQSLPEFQELKPIHNAPNIPQQGPDAFDRLHNDPGIIPDALHGEADQE